MAGEVAAQQPALDKDHAEKMARGLDIFKKQVRPILVSQCLECHGGKKTQGELDITDRDRLLKGGDHGPAFVSGDAKKSLLYLLIAHQKKEYMPYDRPKLSNDAIQSVAAWIDNGAPYDSPLVERKDSKAWTSKVIDAESRKHWAYQPLMKAEPPSVQHESWVQTPIDRFILNKLEAKGIKPNSPAEKRQLIRRAYFDLAGIPPSPEEVEAFLKDNSPDTFAKVIDKLLASPHYGERWARHWLDLVRFAESHGFEHDYDRPTAYHYRDFVIEALNAGLPYDTFVKWQLAGDEIAPNNNLALKATGFLAAGVHSTQITKNEVEKHRYDELDDILSTTTTSMIGLTVGCARCHDHKFDAIPSRDYYQMISTFTTVVRTEVDLNLDGEGYKKAKEAFDKEHAPLEAALKKWETEQLARRFAEWEAKQANTPPPSWHIPEILRASSTGGATTTKKDDGSVLISGTNPPMETLIFVLESELKEITAIRIEALSDPSLVKGGPGRAANGNFALTDFKVKIADKDNKVTEIKLKNPRSTFDQKGLGIAGAIDLDQTTSGWAIDPEFGKDHAAAFDFETPYQNSGKAKISVTMSFRNNVGHGMGRPRLSLTSSKQTLDLKGTGVSENFRKALATPADKRTPEQVALLWRWYRPLDAEWVKLNDQVQKHLAKNPKPATVKALISSEGLPAVRLHTQGEDFLKETHFLRRGDPGQKEGVAPAGYLQSLTAGDAARWKIDAPQGSRLSYRRKAFAEWITDVDNGAGRLLARVIVNRLWQHHMGRGIVATPSDFGTRGEKPTHPELLDYLATELIKGGWRLKPIHKLIMTSAVYQQSSTRDEAKVKVDRDNSLFWRRPVHRLEAEAIHDSLLAISGVLDAKMYGPGTLDEASKRRSIYFMVKRSKLIPMMVIFDAPDGTVGIGDRPSTTIAPQALYLMNNVNVRSWSRNFADRIAPNDKIAFADIVKAGYRTALSREASEDEVKDGVTFLMEQMESYKSKTDARKIAITDFCQTLFCLNEFVYVE
jgi:mono/diheme cytochrome c family protein